MTVAINTDLVSLVSATSSAVYAVISALTLWLLSLQMRDARRFAAAPALYALLKELEEHMSAIRQLGERGTDDPEVRETISRYLEFFERVEHLRGAGVLPATVLQRALGPALVAHLADPRFEQIIQQDAREYEEVRLLAKHIGHRRATRAGVADRRLPVLTATTGFETHQEGCAEGPCRGRQPD